MCGTFSAGRENKDKAKLHEGQGGKKKTGDKKGSRDGSDKKLWKALMRGGFKQLAQEWVSRGISRSIQVTGLLVIEKAYAQRHGRVRLAFHVAISGGLRVIQ